MFPLLLSCYNEVTCEIDFWKGAFSMASHTRSKWLPCCFILLQDLLYGFGDPISKFAFDVMPVYSMLSLRYTMALAVLLLLFGKRIWNGLRQCSVKDWILPTLCMAGAYVVNNIALDLTAATSVAFLRSLATVMTPLLALAAYRRTYRWQHLPIQCLVVVGLYLLCGLGGLSGFGLGEVLSLLSALLLAGSLVFGEHALERVDPITLSTLQAAASALIATVCAPLLDGGWHLERTTPIVWAIIAYMAIGCTLAGYLLQNAALTTLPSRTAALLQCACPVMTAVFSRFVLEERLSVAGIVGAVIILLCVIAETLMEEHTPKAASA